MVHALRDTDDKLRFLGILDREILFAVLASGDPFQLIINNVLPNIEDVYIGQYTGKYISILASRCKGSNDLNPSTSIAGLAVEGESLELRKIDRTKKGRRPRNTETKSALIIPIRGPEQDKSNKSIGMLVLERFSESAFADSDREFAEIIAGQVAIAFLLQKSVRSIRAVQTISSDILLGKAVLADAYRNALNVILGLLEAERGQILIADSNGLRIVVSTRHIDVGIRADEERSVCGQYLLRRNGKEILVINDLSNDQQWSHYYLPLLGIDEGVRMRSEVVVPLVDQGILLGAINIESPAARAFSSLDLGLVTIFAGLVTQAIKSANQSAQAAAQARQSKAAFALAELGAVAATYLHRFGNAVGNARARLFELKQHISNFDIPSLDDMPIDSFIESILTSVREAANEVAVFQERFDPSQMRYETKAIDLCQIIQLAGRRSVMAPHKIIGNLPRAPLMCLATEQIEEVFSCLFTNATESVSSSAEITVMISEEKPESITVTVADNGAGVPRDIRDRIFDFGFTSKKGKRAGKGIGLWFAKLYMQRIGGALWLRDDECSGATFVLEVPRYLHWMPPRESRDRHEFQKEDVHGRAGTRD